MPTPLTPEQKAKLRQSWYYADQVTDLKKHYLKDLRGVQVYGCATSADDLSKIAEHFHDSKKEVANFPFLLGQSPDTHFVDITIAEDELQPGRVLVVAQDSEGRPIPQALQDVLAKELGKHYGQGSTVFSNCAVDQQKNNIDCGPLTVVNGVDTVAAILSCKKSGKSIITASMQENGDYFANRLGIQSAENLKGLRAEHGQILKDLGKDAGNVVIREGSIAEAEELTGGQVEFDYKRKKPLYKEDEFEVFHHKDKEKPEKERKYSFTNPGIAVNKAMEKVTDWIIKKFHLVDVRAEDADKEAAELNALRTGGGGTEKPSPKQQQKPSKEISEDIQKAAENLSPDALKQQSGQQNLSDNGRIPPRSPSPNNRSM